MEFLNKIKWAFSAFTPTETPVPVTKTVDSVVSAFTTVVTELSEVAEVAKAKVKEAEEQISFLKADTEKTIKNLEEHVATQISESERAKLIIEKITQIIS